MRSLVNNCYSTRGQRQIYGLRLPFECSSLTTMQISVRQSCSRQLCREENGPLLPLTLATTQMHTDR